MAKSFIHYDTKNGVEYASIYTPGWSNGKKVNDIVYLGKVIDKKRGIFKNRSRGEFQYSLEKGFSYSAVNNIAILNEERLILDFGDAYCLYEYLKSTPYLLLFENILPCDKDTMMSMLGYKVLSNGANCYAEDWWEGSYTSVLYPDAALKSQRVSEFLKRLGDEGVQREFFRKYLSTAFDGDKEHGILIDSTGMPNAIDLPLTAVNTHGGKTTNEARLIFVVDKITHMPLFFRYNAGNIVDVSTLVATISELKATGVRTNNAILDAGYYSEINMKALHKANIAYLTRVGPNRKLYKELANEHMNDIFQMKYTVIYNERVLYIKRVEKNIFGYNVFCYIIVDHARRSEETARHLRDALDDRHKTPEEVDNELKTKGMFVLLSSSPVEAADILPLYYTRQIIEQIFDITKNDADLLPLRVHSEITFRGHLMLTFLSTILCLLFQKALKLSEFSAPGAFTVLRNQKCKVFSDRIIVKEATKKMCNILKMLGLTSPTTIPPEV